MRSLFAFPASRLLSRGFHAVALAIKKNERVATWLPRSSILMPTSWSCPHSFVFLIFCFDLTGVMGLVRLHPISIDIGCVPSGFCRCRVEPMRSRMRCLAVALSSVFLSMRPLCLHAMACLLR